MHARILKQGLAALILTFIVVLSGCNNRSIMFKTGLKYEYDDLKNLPESKQYRIGINDQLSIRVSPNKGAAILESGGNIGVPNDNVVVEFDGTAKLPQLGSVAVEGLTVREAELMLEELYRQFFVDPFVKLNIPNKRVILFPGNNGSARIITLSNQNTTLLEAIAAAGGVGSNGKAHKVKLIRKDDAGTPHVYLIDLSKIEGVTYANIVLQGNDIVYIEPQNDYLLNFSTRISGFLFVINFLLLMNNLLQ